MTIRRCISDLETNGFLETVTKIHCAVIVDIDTGEAKGFRPHEIDKYLQELSTYDEVWGHNWIKFDEPVLKKLYPSFTPPKGMDTMVLSRLVHPDIKSSDYDRAKLWKAYADSEEQAAVDYSEGRTPRLWTKPVPNPFPAKMIGSYSLAAWGYRLGEHKGDFQTQDDWQTFSEEMFDYMMQDGVVTHLLYQKLMAHEPSAQSVELEHRIARLCFQIEQNGFPFDVQKAIELHGRLLDEREALRVELLTLFPPWKVKLPDFIPKVNNKTRGYVKGQPVERWKEYEFNPASREHIADRLTAKYGWKPTSFTESGKPMVDDDVLSSLPYPEAQKLSRFFLLEKRIGQLAEGNQAWLKVQKNGKIHARYTTNGTVTGRSTHSHPNISQVPRVSSEFGRDCRSLFHVPQGWVQLGADQQGLELRCLASDLSGLAGDGGNYATIVTQGDVHTTNQEAAGLDTRDKAKTFIYAFLYGAGDEKIGSIAGKGKQAGKKLKEAFLAKTPGLAKLLAIVKGAAKRGYIKGIDGRKVPIRSDHAALNMRLQNAGAVVCKQWGCDWDDALKAKGLKHGWDGDYVFLSWSHDEYQLAVRDDPDLIETVKQAGIEAGRNAGIPFNFQCPLDVDVKVGRNWAECH
ncbi:DNA polymerase [Novosphingobium sp. NPDC080210]|uniref:DNA polymerase n=1 Tax=Novosphingobium sp. NPDC080210 TaxID=3390596 RepID=UPI003D00F44F